METHTFHLTKNPQTFKLKNEIKNEEGNKRICVKNIQLEKKFFNIKRETEIEWEFSENSPLAGNIDERDIYLTIKNSYFLSAYLGTKTKIEEPSLQLINNFFGFYKITQNFLKNIQRYAENWDHNIKRIKTYKIHMLSIIETIKNKFVTLCEQYLRDLFFKPGLFDYPITEDNIEIKSVLDSYMYVILRLFNDNLNDDQLFIFLTPDNNYRPSDINFEEITSFEIAYNLHIMLACIVQALYKVFYKIDYGNYLTGGVPVLVDEKQSFLWNSETSSTESRDIYQDRYDLRNINGVFLKSVFTFSDYKTSITLTPGYYGIDWFISFFNSIPGVICTAYKESQIFTIQVFDPFLKLRLNKFVAKLLGLPQDELEVLVVYKGNYDIDSIKYLFIHCEQLDPNYNFYDGKSSTVLATRDTDLCNLEVNPTCKRLVDRNIDELTFSLKNDKGRLVTGEGDGILLEVNIV